MNQSVYDIPVKTIAGQDITLNQYAGKVLLLVNVASKCGLTPQYDGLQKLYKEKQDQGLEILGFQPIISWLRNRVLMQKSRNSAL